MHPRTDELLQHLQHHREQLHETVELVAPSHRERRPSADCWSVAEVLEHLLLMENGVAGLVSGKVAAAGPDGLAAATGTTPVVPRLDPRPVLDRRQRVAAPQRMQPSGTHEARHCAQIREIASVFDEDGP